MMEMTNCKFDIIYVDPPWPYHGYQHGGKGSTRKTHVTDHYPVMNEKELMAFAPSIKKLSADDSLMFMWTTGPMMEFSLWFLKESGFQYKQISFVWEKIRGNPGSYTFTSCEFCVLGKRGKIPTPRGSRDVRQFYQEKRTAHSSKPDEFYNKIEQMFPSQKKIELFARKLRDGWSSWGNEVSSTITI